MKRTWPETLRFVTYLAPSLPTALFETIATYVGKALGVGTSLRCVVDSSAPRPGEPDPLSSGEADVGFLCAPGYIWLQARGVVELVPAAPVFADPRTEGRPVYFSDVVVRDESPARSLSDLFGGVWAYNDNCSLSGWFCLLARLDRMGVATTGRAGAFRELVATGSHPESLRRIRVGEADAAAIDSNVLAVERRRGWSGRVLETWGPFPIQPVVARTALPGSLRRDLAAALLAMPPALLTPYDVRHFAPTSDAQYDEERRLVLSHEQCA